jgi:hypothetical protein
MVMHGSVRCKRPWLLAGAFVLTMSLLASACGSDAGGDQAKAATTKAKRGPFFCDAVGDGTPLGGGHGTGNGSHVATVYEGKHKGALNEADCRQLKQQFDQANAATEGLETRGAAEAAGWHEIAQYIPGLGTHHIKGSYRDIFNAQFDPAKPVFLIYGGLDADAPLVGLSYVASGESDPPAAFAGTNDWWHLHQRICLGPAGDILAGAEEIPDEECTALGGRQIDLGAGFWLLHVWMVPDYELKLDVFASGHPCLGETEPMDRDDPCWDHVDRHPADGVPAGHTADGHGHGTEEDSS